MKASKDEVQLDRRRAVPVRAKRFLRLKEVLAICGKSRSSIYEAIKRGEFPPPVKLGENSSAWLDTEIADWMNSRIEASRPARAGAKRASSDWAGE